MKEEVICMSKEGKMKGMRDEGKRMRTMRNKNVGAERITR